MPAWDDPAEFIDPDDFGEWAVVTFQAGGTRRICVLYDDPAAGLQFVRRNPRGKGAHLGDYESDQDAPQMVATVADMAGIKRRDGVVIGGHGSFAVMSDPQPDGNGCATVRLARE